MQTAIGVERQLFGRTTVAVNFTNARGVHELRTVDINAPNAFPGYLPAGTPTEVQLAIQGSLTPVVRPLGNNIGDIYNYQSDGNFKQSQVLVNVNTTIGKRAQHLLSLWLLNRSQRH
jgi:hypothetical protein